LPLDQRLYDKHVGFCFWIAKQRAQSKKNFGFGELAAKNAKGAKIILRENPGIGESHDPRRDGGAFVLRILT
jgi:hypothetical protein